MCTANAPIDECHTLTQRDLKYTLFHFKKRVARSTITSMMCRLDEVHGIKSASVFGYEAVSLGEEIDSHPGMHLIIDSLKRGSDALDIWTAGWDIRKNKHGLLYYHLPGFNIEEMTRVQLLNHMKQLNRTLEEKSTKIVELETTAIQNEELKAENRRLKRRLDIQEHVFISSGRASELLPPSP